MTFVVRGELVDRMPSIVEVAASMPSNDVGREARIGGALVLLIKILLRAGQAGCQSGSGIKLILGGASPRDTKCRLPPPEGWPPVSSQNAPRADKDVGSGVPF